MGQAGDNAGAACSLPFITAVDRSGWSLSPRGAWGYFISDFLLADLLFVLRRIAGPFFLANVVLMWPSGAVFGRETGMAEGIRGLFRVPFETGRPGIPSLFCVFTGFLLVLVHAHVRKRTCIHTREYMPTYACG